MNRKKVHWDDVAVHTFTFLGVFYNLYQKSATEHETLAGLFKNGLLVPMIISSFVLVGAFEMRSSGVSDETSRAGKSKGAWRRIITAFAIGYGIPAMSTGWGG